MNKIKKRIVHILFYFILVHNFFYNFLGLNYLDFSYLNEYDTNTIDAVSIFDNLKPYLKRRISDNHKELSLNSFNVENNNIILHVYVGEFGDQSYYIIIDKNKRKVIRISKLWRKESISLEKENKLD